MYCQDSEDNVRAVEVLLGNPENRGVARSCPLLDGKKFFTVEIDLGEGTCKYVLPDEEEGK